MPGASYLSYAFRMFCGGAPVPWETCDDQNEDRWCRYWCVRCSRHPRHTDYRMEQVVTGAGKLSPTRCHLPRSGCAVWGTNPLSDAPTAPPALGIPLALALGAYGMERRTDVQQHTGDTIMPAYEYSLSHL